MIATVEKARFWSAIKAVRIIERVGPGEYRVASRSRAGKEWDVNLNVDPPCYCEDSEFARARVGPCAHEIRCRMQEAYETGNWDDDLLHMMQEMLETQAKARASVLSESVSGVLRNADGEVVTGGATKLLDVGGNYYDG